MVSMKTQTKTKLKYWLKFSQRKKFLFDNNLSLHFSVSLFILLAQDVRVKNVEEITFFNQENHTHESKLKCSQNNLVSSSLQTMRQSVLLNIKRDSKEIRQL
jgi:hypothetical protein